MEGVETEVQRLEKISQEIIGACIEVHRHLGPGLLESTYSECVCDEFLRRGIAYRRGGFVSFFSKGKRLKTGYKNDLFSSGSVVGVIETGEKRGRTIY